MAVRGIPSQMVDTVMQSPEQIVNAESGRKCYQSRWNDGGTVFLLRLIVADCRDTCGRRDGLLHESNR